MRSIIIAIAIAAASTAANAEIVATSKLKDGEIMLSNKSCPFGGMDRMLIVKMEPGSQVTARGCWRRSGSAVLIEWMEGRGSNSLPREMNEQEFMNRY